MLLAVAVSGCELARWLRLLSFKKQLGDLEHYARIEERDGLTVHFLKPVVYTEDIGMLINDETSRTTNGHHITWLWTFEKQSLQPGVQPHEFDLSVGMEFENHKLTELRFPERFTTIMPKSIILGLLRTVGQAKIDLKHGSVNAAWAGPGPNQKIVLPSKTQVLTLLGEPFLSHETNQTRTVLYKFYQKTPEPESPADRLAWATFTFDPKGEDILSSKGVIGNACWDLTRAPGQSEPQISFSMLPVSVEAVAIMLPPEIGERYVGQYRSPEGGLWSVGRDGDVFGFSYRRGTNGWWTTALPETTNSLFALPEGDPSCEFFSDSSGVVTGLVSRIDTKTRTFAKVANQLPPPPAEMTWSKEHDCAEFTGDYKGGRLSAKIIGEKGRLFLLPREGCRLPLYAASETNFFFRALDGQVTFVKNEQGAVTKLILHCNGKDEVATKAK